MTDTERAHTDEERAALDLMRAFAERTGVGGQRNPDRYLWTDAFAVCTLLGLGEVDLGLRLVEQVHGTLGRYRADDPRRGWISGLPDERAGEHPTRGGLRIGKRLSERSMDEPSDELLEWDRELDRLLGAAIVGLHEYATSGELQRPADSRLAFRELGLAIGLQAVPLLAGGAPDDPKVGQLTVYVPLRGELDRFWLRRAHRESPTWIEHRNINEVMLATSLAPGGVPGVVTSITVALAGDTMLGRGVADQLQAGVRPDELFAPDLVELTRAADLFILNLECCISRRGQPWPDPYKPFFFRAPPGATAALTHLGVDCASLANNHALDFGADALRDTVEHLHQAGIATVGAGMEIDAARAPVVMEASGFRLGVIGVSDHPSEFAAGVDHPGIGFADLGAGEPRWLLELVTATRQRVDALLVTPHWGPNMTTTPVAHIRRSAPRLLGAGATLIAGHSAHVFHGVASSILYDLGDFIDDYAVDPVLRNDLGLLWLVTLDEHGPIQLEAIPLRLEYCRTGLADGAGADWVRGRFTAACAALGTRVTEELGRLVVRWRPQSPVEVGAR